MTSTTGETGSGGGGKVAIVTGGTYGLGRGVTLELARRGWRVVAFGLDARQPGSAAENGRAGTRLALQELGLDAELLAADVTSLADIARVTDVALQKFGRVDGLVNNAAIHPGGTILDTTEASWDRVLDVNLKGMFLMTKAVLPHMIEQGGGSIVNIASKAGWGQRRLLAYSASKGGVLGMTFALAYDHLQDHIRVNAVVPTGMLSGMTEGVLDAGGRVPDNVGGRWVLPADVAKSIAFLLSDDAELISGTVINVGSFAGQGGMSGGAPARPAATGGHS